MVNRREVLLSAPPAVVAGAGLGALATCNAQTGIQIDPSVLVAINNAVAQGCNFIPAVTTIIAVVDAAFPAINGATTIAASVLNEISSMLCAHTPTTVAGKLGTKTLNAGGKDIPVHGWVIVDGKLTYV
jgi:hypothetical protein